MAGMGREFRGFAIGLAVVSAVVAFVLVVSPATDRPPRYVHVDTGDWPPFTGRNLPGRGPMTEFVRTALRIGGFDADVRFHDSWDDAERRARAGESAGAFPFIRAAEREGLYFSRPLCWYPYGFFYKKAAHRKDGRDLGALHSKDELRSLRVARVSGYRFWDDMQDLDAVAGDGYDSLAEAFQALEEGRKDLLAEGRIAGEFVLNAPDNGLDRSHYGFLGADGEPWLGDNLKHLHLITTRESVRDAFDSGFDAAVGELGIDMGSARARDPEGPAGPNCDVYLPFEPGGRTRVVIGGPAGPVVATDPTTRALAHLLRGTRAVVLEWGEGYGSLSAASSDPLEPGPCRVKVMNGPLHGHVLDVSCDDLQIGAATGPGGGG